MTDESKPVEEQVESQAQTEEEVKADPTVESIDDRPPIPRSQVTKIVLRERQDAYQKAKKEFMAEVEALKAEQAPVAPQAIQQNNVGMGGMPSVNPEQLQQMISEATQKLFEKSRADEQQRNDYQRAQQLAQSFNSQMAQSKLEDPDFDDKIKDLDFASISPLVHLATETGMAGDIMVDLDQHPQKITHLMMLAHTQPKLAQREMNKLAASIKANKTAVQQNSPKDPLDQITPSTVGTDSGNMSVHDYRKMFL